MERVHLSDWDDLRGVAADELERQFPHPFLVVAVPEDAAEEDTTTLSGVGERRRLAPLEGLRAVRGDERAKLLVLAVTKKATTFGDQIWIGRASNCDVVLPFATISKVHAMVSRRDGGWVIGDAGSKNGTAVEGRTVERGQSAPLADGARIAFGKLEARFYGPRAFAREVLAP